MKRERNDSRNLHQAIRVRLRPLFSGTAVVASLALFAIAISFHNAQAEGWRNPEVFISGRCVTDARYDPFTGQIVVRTGQTTVRESYLDPNRGQIDDGSFRRVNRVETDLNGVRWHVTGTQWTSYGVPHGNLSRRRIVNSGGIVEDRNEHVAYDAGINQRQPQRQSQRQPYRGGVVEDRNERVGFSVPSNNSNTDLSRVSHRKIAHREPRSEGQSPAKC
ncbi:MAG: hypothetical protein ACR2NZ_16105 [Rubripirellula sp.]